MGAGCGGRGMVMQVARAPQGVAGQALGLARRDGKGRCEQWVDSSRSVARRASGHRRAGRGRTSGGRGEVGHKEATIGYHYS